MATVKGKCDQAYSKIRDLLAANVESDEELGASICVNIEGTNVVDIWAGHVDENRTKEWEEDTIVNVWSCSKTVSKYLLLVGIIFCIVEVVVVLEAQARSSILV